MPIVLKKIINNLKLRCFFRITFYIIIKSNCHWEKRKQSLIITFITFHHIIS